jgi:trypsin
MITRAISLFFLLHSAAFVCTESRQSTLRTNSIQNNQATINGYDKVDTPITSIRRLEKYINDDKKDDLLNQGKNSTKEENKETKKGKNHNNADLKIGNKTNSKQPKINNEKKQQVITKPNDNNDDSKGKNGNRSNNITNKKSTDQNAPNNNTGSGSKPTQMIQMQNQGKGKNKNDVPIETDVIENDVNREKNNTTNIGNNGGQEKKDNPANKGNDKTKKDDNKDDDWDSLKYGSVDNTKNETDVSDVNVSQNKKESSPSNMGKEDGTKPSGSFTKKQARIIGGTSVTNVREFPYIGFPVGDKNCVATLFHDDLMLTAATCTDAFDSGVFLGGTKIDGSQSKRLAVAKSIPHPDFDFETHTSDIMILKLKQPVPNVPKVKLNLDDPLLPAVSQILDILGYGATSETGNLYSETLQKARVMAAPDDRCTKYKWYKKDTMVCTWFPGGGRDSCSGDAGGPILLRATTTQVALVSFGLGCGNKEFPSVNTRVSVHSEFIKQTMCTESVIKPSGISCSSISTNLLNNRRPGNATYTE